MRRSFNIAAAFAPATYLSADGRLSFGDVPCFEFWLTVGLSDGHALPKPPGNLSGHTRGASHRDHRLHRLAGRRPYYLWLPFCIPDAVTTDRHVPVRDF